MDACTASALIGVMVGAALGAGVPTRRTERVLEALGGDRIAKLTRLLELLEEPEPSPEEDDTP